MAGRIRAGAALALAVCVFSGFISQAAAETLVEHSAEVRMQLDLVVPDAALKAFLPAGFESNVATAGAAKDCNLRMVFIDRVDVTKPDGAPAGSDRLVYLAAPIKQAATNTVGQMLVFGITTDPAQAPGPFGVYAHAATHRMERVTRDSGEAAPLVEETWEFSAPGGEHMQMHLTYERGIARKGGAPTKFFSSAKPDFYQIFKIEQGLDIMRNATIKVADHVKSFDMKAGGGKIAPLFDGSERVVSIDAQPWYNRAIYLP